MKREGVAHRIGPRAVTAPTSPTAESASSGKDLMVRLAAKLLVERDG